ncbi:hypothetical protein KJ359_003735 [Pestalotiopsis sp. 9143b]|nr:hypothetical protein KJ359_003735 [Pestalotiopsis sp. 9143b]
MDWIERLVLGFLETVEPSPDMTIATPEAALHWMIEVTGFVILLALFESHTTYMIMLRAAPAFCNGDGQRWLTYAHRLDSTVIPRYLLENNSLEESFNYARRRLDGDEYDRKLVDIWRRELIPLSEKSAVWGDKMHALHEMVQDFKDIKSPADFPDNWDSRMAEIFDAIDSRYKC